jgi:selenocysteine lyase/cysteine desulfurase
MGLGLLYGGLRLRADQEVLSTKHDHYSTETSLRLRAERTGARVRQVPLYERPSEASADEIVGRLVRAVRPETRFVAVTWVHSVSGVKLPIRALSDALATINAERAPGDRAILCVDGVHGFGAEDVRLPELGCDFFVAGCHKWIFGPRGTGIVWGRAEAWPEATATIPTFDAEAYGIWMGQRPAREIPVSVAMTPGGFQAFEHRWALDEAFRLQLAIGKARVAARIHELNTRLKNGLAEMPHVTLHTPRDEKLSAGIVCFDIAGLAAADVAGRLRERGIVASVTPYRTTHARLAPSLLTSEEDVDRALVEVGALRRLPA